MIKLILCGSSGKMGKAVTKSIASFCDLRIVAGIDSKTCKNDCFPVFNTPGKVNIDADVIIDFSNPELIDSLLNYSLYKKLPMVVCTTGFSDLQIDRIKKAATSIPIFFSGNMSIGVNLLIELSKKAAEVLCDSFDIEIIEKHHNQKIDAPSGTALMIANAINSDTGNKYNYVYDRHNYRKKRMPKELGIHSVRGGTIVGEHEVIFAGNNEVLTLSHSAQSKEVFAVGAINAARFIVRQKPGLYNMSDLLK